MLEVIRAIRMYAGWLYILLALAILVQLVVMWRAGRQRHLALFALEREAATGKAIRGFVTLLLLVTIWAGVYSVSQVIAPGLPEDQLEADVREPLVETPALSDELTPEPTETPTLEPSPRPRIVTATPAPPPESP